MKKSIGVVFLLFVLVLGMSACGSDTKMVRIPAGSFQMGSTDQGDQRPVHTVTLDAFEMDIYEVTNAEYALCVKAGVCSVPGPSNSLTRDSYYGNRDFANYPVITVSWFDANTYCSWRGARLPTEAEWEYAARGGLEGALYPWGDDEPVCETGAKNGASYSDCSRDTLPVGSFVPNGYGLYDMAGNVWEWTADWYSAEYYATVENGVFNPLGPSEGVVRVLRGGSWIGNPYFLRVSYRGSLNPSDRSSSLGFRCVR